jgi:hypothetical protein
LFDWKAAEAPDPVVSSSYISGALSQSNFELNCVTGCDTRRRSKASIDGESANLIAVVGQ